MALTAAGINLIAQTIIGQGIPLTSANAYIGVGNGTVAFNAAQTDLQGESTIRKGMDAGYPSANPPSAVFRSIFAPEEANFAWQEWGIFNSATGGTMLNRVVESNGTKLDNQTWILEVNVTFELGD